MSDNFGIALGQGKGFAMLPLGITDNKRDFLVDIKFSTTYSDYYRDYDYMPLIVGMNEYRTDNDVSFALKISNGKLVLYTRGFAAASDGTDHYNSDKTVGDGNVHHVMILVDGTTISMVVDDQTIQTGLTIKDGVALSPNYPMCVAADRPYSCKIGIGNMVLYELKVYDACSNDDALLKAWYSPTIDDVKAHMLLDKSGHKNDAAIEKQSNYDYRIERDPITYVENGETKQYKFVFFPYKNKGMLYPYKLQTDESISKTGYSFSGINDVIFPESIREFWVRFDAYIKDTDGKWEVKSTNARWTDAVMSYGWWLNDSLTSHTTDLKNRMVGRHSYVLHMKGGGNGIIELFMDDDAEPVLEKPGRVFGINNYVTDHIEFSTEGSGEFSDIVISDTVLSTSDHSTDADIPLRILSSIPTAREVYPWPVKDVGIKFNGTDNYINLPRNTINGKTKFIFDLTFSTTETRGRAVSDDDTSIPVLFADCPGGYRNGTFNLGVDEGCLALHSNLDSDNVNKYFSTGIKVNDGKKHNVKMIGDGKKVTLYLDGTKFETENVANDAIDCYWGGETYLHLGKNAGNGIYTKDFTLYDFKIYKSDNADANSLTYWLHPTDMEANATYFYDKSGRFDAIQVSGSGNWKYVVDGEEKQPMMLPYMNRGIGKTLYYIPEERSATGIATNYIGVSAIEDVDELWIKYDVHFDGWNGYLSTWLYDKDGNGFVYSYNRTWDTHTIRTRDEKESRKNFDLKNRKTTIVFHIRRGTGNDGLIEMFLDDDSKPFLSVSGDTSFDCSKGFCIDAARRYNIDNIVRVSNIVVSKSELTTESSCTDKIDPDAITMTAPASRTLGYTSEQEIPTSRRITYQYETKDTYSTMRRLSAAVTEQFATEREVWSPYVYIRDAIDAVRVIQRSFGFNVRTERNTLKDAKNDRASKKHVTLENLRMFLSCCDERFVQQKPGFGLSSNDFTDKYKERIRSIDENAEKNTVIGISVDDLDLDIPKSRVINLGAITEDDILSLANEVFGKS